LRRNHNFGVTDTLPFSWASLTTKAMVHCILHMWYSTLAFCICDYITYWSIASYQDIFLSIPVEDKLKSTTHEIDYSSLHNTHICHSAQQNSIPAI